MPNINYRIKKTISMKQFIAEFGENFSEKMKEKLLELEIRCVLTRKENKNILDIKHVEHTQYECNVENALDSCKKEYSYGQLIVIDGLLYFSEKCAENNLIMQSSIVDTIYNSLNSEIIFVEPDTNAKKIDDSNIDYVIDTMLTVFPEVSQRYINIVKEMLSHERN